MNPHYTFKRRDQALKPGTTELDIYINEKSHKNNILPQDAHNYILASLQQKRHQLTTHHQGGYLGSVSQL